MSRTNRQGVAGLYTLVMLTALIGITSLAVDFGRVQLTKTELRVAADAAARAAAATIPNGIGPSQNEAITFAAANNADGKPVVLDPANDIFYGHWDTASRTFTELTGDDRENANAVKVVARRTAARGNPVSLVWGHVIGRDGCDVTGTCIAMLIPGINVDQNVPATANPFLAGAMPGTKASLNNPHHNPDTAGNSAEAKQSPLAVAMPITDGLNLTFDSINGTARHDPNLAFYNPDGELGDIGHNNPTPNHSNNYNSNSYNENGIADATMPINALVGVFLSDEDPAATSAPSNLDFSSAGSRDFASLQPELKQIFFIGDGLDSRGLPQTFVAPKGATRLFLATWDFYEWNNNYGFRNVKVIRPQQVVIVQ